MAALRPVLAAALLVLSACGAPKSSGAQIGAALDALAAKGAFSGAVVITRGDSIVFEGAYGAEDGAAAFTLSSASDGASIAKTLTAAAILSLAQEGRLDLDAPAQVSVPEFPYPDVTVRHLLSHVVSLPDYDAFAELIDAGPVTTLDLIEALSASGVKEGFPAGSAFAYCNLCYDVLGLIAERVEGESLGAILGRRYFEPLGMTNAFLRPARFADWPSRQVRGFRRGEKGTLEPFGAIDNEGFHGASNIYFSARDLSAWARAWAASEPPIRAVRASALAPARIGDETSGITLGSWYCAEDGERCHYTGSHNGFYSVAAFDSRSGLTLALVSNVALPGRLQIDLSRALIAIAEGKTVDRAALIAAAARDESDPADPTALAGAYAGPGIQAFAIDIRDGAAFVDAEDAPPMRAYRIEPKTFHVPGLDLYLGVTPNAGDGGGRLRWTTLYRDVIAERR